MELVFISTFMAVMLGGSPRAIGQHSDAYWWLVRLCGGSAMLLLMSSPVLYFIDRRYGLITWITLLCAVLVGLMFPALSR